MALVTETIAVFIGPFAGFYTTCPDAVLEIDVCIGLQFSHQYQLIACVECDTLLPGPETGFADGNVIGAGGKLKIEAGCAIGLAIDINLIPLHV